MPFALHRTQLLWSVVVAATRLSQVFNYSNTVHTLTSQGLLISAKEEKRKR